MSDSDDESYIIEAERKAKQNFLTEEILECDYDPELFMMFCGTKKEANVDVWTFEELQECVHEFKMTYRRGQSLKEVQEGEAKKEAKKSQKSESLPEPEKKIETVQHAKSPEELPKSEAKPEAKPEARQTSPIKNEVSQLNSQPVKTEPKIVPTIPTALASSPQGSKEKNQVLERSATGVGKASEPEFVKSKTINEAMASNKSEESKKEEAVQGKIEENKLNEDAKEAASAEVTIVDQKFSIKCAKLEEDDLSAAETLEFEVSEPELIEGGFFSSNYYLYPVKIQPLQLSFKRRFSDFVWLREMLYLILPGAYIPPISSSKSGSAIEEALKRRKIVLKFLQAISRIKNLLRTPVVEGFFKTADYQEFLSFQKNMKKKLKKPEGVEQVLLPEGSAECDLTYQGPRAEKLLEYATCTESIENRLKKQAELVKYDIKSMELSFNALKELVKQLEDAQNMLPYTDGLKKIYASLGETFSSLSSQESARISIFEEYYHLYFKYSLLEKTTIKELLKERESIFSDFTKAEIKQKNVEKCRNMYGYVNMKTLGEVERVIETDMQLMNQNFIKFSQENVDLTSQLHLIWTKLIDSLSSI